MWCVVGFGLSGVGEVGMACVLSMSLCAYDLREVFVLSEWR